MLQGLNEDLAFPLLQSRPVIRAKSHELSTVTGKRVLVTGAGGSIGSELTIQIAGMDPAALLLLDHSEYALYEINMTIETNDYLPFPTTAVLCDIRDEASVNDVFKKFRPDIVFHAAALKHVPLLESNVNRLEAVRTNVAGTYNLLQNCAILNSAFVLVSTDKAVNPSSWMGTTKRLAEIVSHMASLSYDIGISQVRFGNVIGSSGSVVPLFRRQIAKGGPVTVTHPDMTRYMMTIKEAVGLTLQSSVLSQKDGGYSNFVLDMGEPVKIIDLAKELIRQTGQRPDVDIPVTMIGMRPGEKLHEELHYPWEELVDTEEDRVRRAVSSFDPTPYRYDISRLLQAAEYRDLEKVIRIVSGIITT